MAARLVLLYVPTGMSPVTYSIQLSAPRVQAICASGYRSVPPVTASRRSIVWVPRPCVARETLAEVAFHPTPQLSASDGWPPSHFASGVQVGVTVSVDHWLRRPRLIAAPRSKLCEPLAFPS